MDFVSPERPALLALEHISGRWALQHAVLEGGVVPKLLERQAVQLPQPWMTSV